MATDDQLKLIATRIHPRIKEKGTIWKLISDSYAGGETYLKSGNLFRHIKEGRPEYEKRKERSIFFNHVQPIADTLAGFLYAHKIDRTVPADLTYLIEKASKGKNFDSFMQTLATHSMMYTCAVLVDSPEFDPTSIKTKQDRKESGLNPYCTIYFPWQIRDFSLNDQGELEWIILDDCQYDNSDPMVPGKEKEIYSLWTKTEYFKIVEAEKDTGDNAKSFILEKTFAHNLDCVPVIFSNFRDADDDRISETPFEDIALLDRAIYNYLSYLDEMMSGGTFKMLFVPIEKQDDLPTDLLTSGVANLTVFPYNGKLATQPVFLGSGLGEITPFISVVEMFLKEIFAKVGLDKDQEKAYVQSGIAKLVEFQKCESFLRIGAEQLEQTETKIFEILAKWEKSTNPSIKIEYQKKFTQEELDTVLGRLTEALLLPSKAIQDLAISEIAKKTFSYLDEDKQNKLLVEIEKESKAKIGSTVVDQAALDAEKIARNNGGVPSNNGQDPKGKQNV